MIDLSTMLRGITPQALARYQQSASRCEAIWEHTIKLASAQPLTSSLEPAQMDAMRGVCAQLRAQGSQLVVIGTGGASLGAQALCALDAAADNIHFLSNADSESTQRLLAKLNLNETAFLIISKSGETMETLATTLAVMAHARTQNIDLKPCTAVITQPAESTLMQLALQQGWPVLHHPANLGGRFSVFSIVGMMPLCFAGLDVEAILRTADDHFMTQLRTQDRTLFESACWLASSIPEQPMHVLFAYGDRLRALTEWYKQCWAESLGKDLRGPTPITSIGAIDQHSQLQLYLGGPRDKLFTMLAPEMDAAGCPLADCALPQLSHLRGKHLHQVLLASAEATIATLRAHGIALRTERGAWDLAHVARWMVSTMLETLMVAAILQVDPFTQPTVEEGKKRAREALANA